eukprot:scaffold5818_cov84-Cylindrotheca_fusiformis.AAC.2
MKSFAFLISILALIHGSFAFTPVHRNTSPMNKIASPVVVGVENKQQEQSSSTSLKMFVDWGIPEVANASSVGSILSLFACVSIWELITPGRAKKE